MKQMIKNQKDEAAE